MVQARTRQLMLFLAGAVFLVQFMVCQTPVLAAKLPAGVTHRLEKIDRHMTSFEESLADGRVRQNELDNARVVLEEIYKQYPQNTLASEVRAAANRIAEGKAAADKKQADTAAAKEEQVKAEKATEATAEEWAEKLSAYKPDDREGSKGAFGHSTDNPELLKERAPLYREAKAVYAEFLATGIDKDSHPKLRQAEWNIVASIENYESSMAYLMEAASVKVKYGHEWLQEQKGRQDPLCMSTSHLKDLRDAVAGVKVVFPPEDAQLTALLAEMDQVEKLQIEVEKVVLQKRKMKPDAYKGADAGKIKELAKSIVLKEDKQLKILRVHITNSDWTTESATEWTDSTKSSIQHRVTKGLNVQIALKKGADCFLYSVFVHRDTVDGAAKGLTGHVTFRDKFLEQNVPK